MMSGMMSRDSVREWVGNSSRKPLVLLVEDNDVVRQINRTFLQDLGCKVDTASHAREVFTIDPTVYDMIFLDIGLPGINGIDLAKTIREKYGDKLPPIVAVTAFGDIVESDCMDAGINEVAVKPISMEGISGLLQTWLPVTLDYISV